MKSTKNRQAFSLIELLSVIAIIAILSAILIPVISGMREKAMLAKCSNNLRQMGTAISLYAQDHNGKYPGPAWVTVRHDVRFNSNEYKTLTQYIAPYLGYEITRENYRQNVIIESAICPKYESQYAPEPGVVGNEGHYQRHPLPDRTPFGGRQGSSSNSPLSQPLTIFNVSEKLNAEPSEIIALFTMDASGGYGPREPIYDGARNYLFLDNHIELIPGDEFPF